MRGGLGLASLTRALARKAQGGVELVDFSTGEVKVMAKLPNAENSLDERLSVQIHMCEANQEAVATGENRRQQRVTAQGHPRM